VATEAADHTISIWGDSLTKLYATYYSKQLSGKMVSEEYSVLDSFQTSFSDHLITAP